MRKRIGTRFVHPVGGDVPDAPRFCCANIGRGDPSPTISTVVGWFKFHSTKDINAVSNASGRKIFQRSFYDHIIRNQHDYDEVAKYIYENPMRWKFDKLYGSE